LTEFKLLQRKAGGNWVLVLPPWGDMYHWQSHSLEQHKLPWSLFFDTSCLNKFVPIIEFEDFIRGLPFGLLLCHENQIIRFFFKTKLLTRRSIWFFICKIIRTRGTGASGLRNTILKIVLKNHLMCW
jgi:hypothetical protein